MKRTLKPTGSRFFSAPKRTRTAAVVVSVPRNRFRQRAGINSTSLFQPNIRAPEKKNVDLFTSTFWTNASGSWTITPINLIAQGTTANQHIGRKAVMTSVLVRGWLALGNGPYPVRIVVVYDKETNGAVAAATDIFAINDSMSPMNLANSDRFTVVADVTPIFNGQSAQQSVSGSSNVAFEIFRKMSLPIQFNDTTTATITAINTGSLLVCCCAADNGTAIGAQETYSRVRFIDN